MASEKITNIIEEIKSLTIIELADLVKAVERKSTRLNSSHIR